MFADHTQKFHTAHELYTILSQCILGILVLCVRVGSLLSEICVLEQTLVNRHMRRTTYSQLLLRASEEAIEDD